MNDSTPSLKQLFDSLVDIPKEKRNEAVQDACGGDIQLEEKLLALLSAFDDAGSFLEHPFEELEATLRFDSGSAQARPEPSATTEMQSGGRIGPYKLLQLLGEGGMGSVWMAEQQEPVRRKVALKIIKAGLDSKSVIARFEAERQALAMMDHQNIARVMDAGSSQQGPYFVMELVKGEPITEYCDRRKLTLQERLKVFLPVCRAVQHAHQKGVIHRDIKPSNVLVTQYDGEPVPKVIDFGVAKAAGRQLTDKTMFTEFGQIIGTLEYMSPEQAELNQLDVDTRTDVYSLGVLLYELLTGSTPFSRQQLGALGFEQILRTIREEDPPKPSTRLSGSGDALPNLSSMRGSEPSRLSGLVRGDLDWITMKTLEKERTRRYESASELAMDIERYLNGQVVEACPPSFSYRTKKLIRRHRVAFGTVFLFMFVLMAAAGVSTWQAMAAIEASKAQRAAASDAKNAWEEESVQRQRAQEAAADAIQFAEQAKLERQRAIVNEDKAMKSQFAAEQETRRARAHRLATEARTVFETHPQRSLLLAVQAMETTSRDGEPIVDEATEVLKEGLMSLKGRPCMQLPRRTDVFGCSANGRWLVTGSPTTTTFMNADGRFSNGSVEIWDLNSPDSAKRRFLPRAAAPAAFDASQRWLVTASTESGAALLWDLSSYDGENLPHHFKLSLPARPLASRPNNTRSTARGSRSSRPPSAPNLIAFAFAREASKLVTQYAENTVAVWDFSNLAENADQDIKITPIIHWSPPPAGRFSVATITWDGTVPESGALLSNDGRWLVIQPSQIGQTSSYQPPQLFDLESEDSDHAVDLQDRFRVQRLALDPKSRWLVVGYGIDPSESDPRRMKPVDPNLDKPVVRVFDLRDEDPDDPMVLYDAVSPFAFTNDGSRLITGRRAGGLLCYSTNDDTLSDPVTVTSVGRPAQISTSSKDRWVAAAFDYGGALVWDFATIQPNDDSHQTVSPVVYAEGATVAFDQNEEWFATSSANAVFLYDLRIEQPHGIELRGHDGEIAYLEIDAVGDRLVTLGSIDKTIRLWDLGEKQTVSYPFAITSKTYNDRLDGRRVPPYPLGAPAAFSPRGKWLAAFGDDRPIKLWDLNAFGIDATPRQFGDPSDDVVRIDFTADENYCISANLDGELTLWDLSGDSDMAITGRKLTGVSTALHKVSVTEDGRWLIGMRPRSATLCNTFVWDLANTDLDSKPRRYPGYIGNVTPGGYLTLLTFAADGASQRINFVKLGDEDDSKNQIMLPEGERKIIGFDANWLVTQAEDEIQLWDISGLEPPREFVALPPVHIKTIWNNVTLGPNSRWLLTSRRHKNDRPPGHVEIGLWDLEAVGGPRLRKHWAALDWGGYGRSFSPDGRWLVQSERYADDSGSEGIRFWDLSSEDLRETSFKLNITLNNPNGVGRFSGNGRWFTLASYEIGRRRRLVYRFDLNEPDLSHGCTIIPTVTGTGDAMSWDGKWSLSTSTDGWTRNATLHSLDPQVLKELAQKFVGRSLAKTEQTLTAGERTFAALPPVSGPHSPPASSSISRRRSRDLLDQGSDTQSDRALPYMFEFDTNSDGILQAIEWSRIRTDWSFADIDGDGEITLDELTEGMKLQGDQRKFVQIDSDNDWLLREDELAQPLRAFFSADVDGDEIITEKELLATGTDQSASRFTLRDRNRDGELSSEEWSTLSGAAKFDENKDGRLSSDEFRQYRRDKYVRDQLSRYDHNRDGKLDKWEASIAGLDASSWDTDKNHVISLAEMVNRNHAHFDERISEECRNVALLLQHTGNQTEAAKAAHHAGTLLKYSGRLDDAAALFEQALALRSATVGDNDMATVAARVQLAQCYLSLGRSDESINLLTKALSGQKSCLGSRNARTREMMEKLFDLTLAAGQSEQALSLAEELVQVARQQYEEDHVSFVKAAVGIAEKLLGAQQFEAAEGYMRECQKLLEDNSAATGPRWGGVLSRLGASLAGKTQTKLASANETFGVEAKGIMAEAETLLLEAIENIPDDGSASAIRVVTTQRIVDLYAAMGDTEKAKHWRQRLTRLTETGN